MLNIGGELVKGTWAGSAFDLRNYIKGYFIRITPHKKIRHNDMTDFIFFKLPQLAIAFGLSAGSAPFASFPNSSVGTELAIVF